MTTDAELLDREVALLWGRDDCDRHEPGPLRVVLAPIDGPQQPPAAVLDKIGPGGLELRGCRSFVLDGSATPATPVPLVTSSGPQRDLLRLLRPNPWWSRREWSSLLRGSLGPWAATVESAPVTPDGGDRLTVTALCHTPRLKDGSAEAGVWTHPDHRRRGLAVAATSAWSGLAGRECHTLFYSARPDNHASLATAARLGARPIGTIWQLWPLASAGSPGGTGQGTSETSIA